MKKFLKIFAIALPALFAVLFTVYFFNLDMKFVAKFVEPLLDKHYDKIERKQYV